MVQTPGWLVRPAILRFLVALAALLGSPAAAWAQAPTATPTTTSATPTLLSGGQGPRLPFIGPSTPPPDPEGPPRDTSTLPPGRTARCRWDLRGAWEVSGRQTDPSASTYRAQLNLRQYGNYLTADKSGQAITYYGVCSGDRVELDAYSGDQLVGAYTGTVSGNGRRIESTWVLYTPDYSAGYETLTAASPPATR